jgi:hypothetical protein
MATQQELATRILRRLKVLDPLETASPEDLALASEKLRAAHYLLSAEGLLRWTLADIPPFAEEAYVLIGSALAADDFSVARDPEWISVGVRMIQRGVHIPVSDETLAEDF